MYRKVTFYCNTKVDAAVLHQKIRMRGWDSSISDVVAVGPKQGWTFDFTHAADDPELSEIDDLITGAVSVGLAEDFDTREEN